MEQIVPRDKWLYDDRGMMKWMGWLLSDHSAFMDGEKEKENLTSVKPEMELTTISKNLTYAWEKSKIVLIQVNIVENDEYVPEIAGTILGFDNSQIYLQLNSGEIKPVHLEEIRCVDVKDSSKRLGNADPF